MITATIDSLSVQFWKQTAIKCVKIILAVFLAAYLAKLFSKWINIWETKAKNYEQLKANDESIVHFFQSFKRITKTALWLIVLIFAAKTISLPHVIPTYLLILMKIYLIVFIGRLLVDAATVITDSVYGLSRKYWYKDTYKEWYERLNKLLPLFQRCLEYVIYVWAASLAILQLAFVSKYASYGTTIVQIIGIFFISRVVVEVVKLLVDKVMVSSEEESSDNTQQKKTLIPIIKSIISFLVYFIAFVLILRAMNINPMPFLAGAGLLGAVIGLGAQPIINDIVSGFFILFEQIILVGDFVEIGSARGTVELIEIRTTRLRNPDGQLHILRNGDINQVVNYSKKYSHAVIEVGVDYGSNLDHVFRVLDEVGRQIKDSDPNVLEPLLVRGLKNFGESELLIRTRTKVKPGYHRDVSFKLRKLIKEAFDKEGIEIPFARRVLSFKNDENQEDEVPQDT
ncbi:MAG: mechanosensitive ion channel family protein [Deltaproteobacteria bacterium]|nr:mechanosensitive ion channel family protein [Deltaproteobacteria bacterium]